MGKKINDLKVKSINELIIPNQLQGYVHLMDFLINNQLDESSICELFKLIDNYSIRPNSIESILYVMSRVFPHKISSFSNIGEILQKRKIIKTFPNIQDFNEKILPGSIIHSIFWDKIDEFVVKIDKETFDINQKLYDPIFDVKPHDKYSLIDLACKYGSENCFKLLKLKGAEISKWTSTYAFEGGNKNIILDFVNGNSFKITNMHLRAALKYHHNDIFDWLLETKGSIGYLSKTECFSNLNIKSLLFLFENGFDEIDRYIFQKLFIFMILYSLIIYVYRYYNQFINHICLSFLLYRTRQMYLFVKIISSSSIVFAYHYYKKFINHICVFI